MCGIWYYSGSIPAVDIYDNIKHRGPDNTVIKYTASGIFVFHRLSINGLENGNQPLSFDNTTSICNGEIYNFKSLATIKNIPLITGSDCEIISPLLNQCSSFQQLKEFCNSLDGVFAIVSETPLGLFAARDPLGVRPLYYGNNSEGLCFSSEAKGLIDFCDNVFEFPIGSFMINNTIIQYCDISEKPLTEVPFHNDTLNSILTASVKKRLMCERDIGFFLSGGLDSSLIAAIGKKELGTIKTFSIGIGNSPDLFFAKKVADFLQTDHTEITFTQEEGIEAIKSVIWALESYDCTTIRASVPMYLLSKYVSQNTDVKVILSGEGADELFGGYLYLHNAPNSSEFQCETYNLLKSVHSHDIIRADRCTAAHGLELRVPFFDRSLINYVKAINPTLKEAHSNIEKKILRDSFQGDYLPHDVLYRQKNGMSDAVGYSWVDFVRQFTSQMISDKEFQDFKRDKNSPMTKEEMYYRVIYESQFGGTFDNVPHVWRPKWTNQTDPSAKLLSHFNV